MKRIPAALMLLTGLFGSPLSASAQENLAVFISPKQLPADVSPQVARQSCGNWTGHYGPIDYRSASLGVKKRVEHHHFDSYLPQYLTWLPGKPFSHYIAANFSYTLRSFPNHPVALLLMEQTGRRLQTEMIPGSYYPLECWYVRGLEATPDDPVVRAMYGIYLGHRGRAKESVANLEIGEKGLCRSGVMQHHIATGYLAAGENARAQAAALRAQKRGFVGASVQSAMEAAGKWERSADTLALRVPDVCASDAAELADEGSPEPRVVAPETPPSAPATPPTQPTGITGGGDR